MNTQVVDIDMQLIDDLYNIVCDAIEDLEGAEGIDGYPLKMKGVSK